MSRDSFFSNLNSNSTSESKPEVSLHPAVSIDQPIKKQSSSSKAKRLTYSIKIDPTIQKSIKDWARNHDVTISSVVETLARLYLNNLSVDDIQQ